MKKKWILSVVLLVGIFLTVVFGREVLSGNIIKERKSTDSTIAMYIQGDDGEYSLSTDTDFPLGLYVLNTEKSRCSNGGVLSLDDAGKIKVQVSSSDVCTLYFDEMIDENGNGIDDATEPHYTVTYMDGMGGTIQVFENILFGLATPGIDYPPTRQGYTFVGWSPEISDTVEEDVTYVAQWTQNVTGPVPPIVTP